jgi:uncharacterized protein
MKSAHLRPRQLRHKSAPYRLRIGRSLIHGVGVFAVELIPEGRKVIEYTGKRLSEAEAYRVASADGDYAIAAGTNCLIDARVGGSGAELINHSCDPNLLWRLRKGRVYFYSRRPVRAGEELTIYYGYQVKARALPCCCGERNCRGTLRFIVE